MKEQLANTKIFLIYAIMKLTMGLKLNGIFATSHGKSPSDGIGGTTEWLVARASLQATENNQILNPNQIFQCTTQHSWNNFFYMSDEEVTSNIKAYELERRYSRCATASGTRSHHCFTPQSKSTLALKGLSSDEKELK